MFDGLVVIAIWEYIEETSRTSGGFSVRTKGVVWSVEDMFWSIVIEVRAIWSTSEAGCKGYEHEAAGDGCSMELFTACGAPTVVR